MKILALMLLRARNDDSEATIVSSAYHLSDLNFFKRDGVREGANFSAKVIAKRIPLGQRSSVEDMGHIFHVHVRSNGLAAAALCDKEYPPRVAFTLLAKLQDEFMSSYGEEEWTRTTKPLKLSSMDAAIEKYQNPQEADSIMRIQQDLDDTKIILYQTIDSVLERGVKLESLVEKSKDLSAQSRMFYRTARRNNSCCGMM